MTPGDVGALVVAAAAVCAALGYFAHKARRFLQIVRAAAIVVERELSVNGGGSIKDDVDGLALSFGIMGRLIDDLDERHSKHIRQAAKGLIRLRAHEHRLDRLEKRYDDTHQ